MKNWRIRNVPYAVNTQGNTSAARLSTQPISTISRYSGMISTTNGIMIVPR